MKHTNISKQIEGTMNKLEMLKVKNSETENTIENCSCNVKELKGELFETEEKMISVVRENAVIISKLNLMSYQREQDRIELNKREDTINKMAVEILELKKAYHLYVNKTDILIKENASLANKMHKASEIAHNIKIKNGASELYSLLASSELPPNVTMELNSGSLMQL